MCGISGELRFDGAEPDLALMGQMLERLARRGPDHEGTWSDGPLLFGHRRLSVIDLSDRSNQPMIDPELGLALVFNGAIYNYLFRRRYRSHPQSLCRMGRTVRRTSDRHVRLRHLESA